MLWLSKNWQLFNLVVSCMNLGFCCCGKMGRTFVGLLTFLLLGFFVCSGDSRKSAVGSTITPVKRNSKSPLSISTTQNDITTPLTMVPTTNFPTTSASPILNPTTIPESPTTVPSATPTTSSPVNPGASWCIAIQTASNTALQIALDYACGYGRADCSAVQPDGSCYYPNTVYDHASYAFNNYYQKNPAPNSCNFGGTAIVTSTDPSSATCQYPSTSTSTSVLDTSNQNRSTVFGAVPPGPPSSSAMPTNKVECILSALWLLLLLLWGNGVQL